MDNFIQALKTKISKGLPGDRAHQYLVPEKRLSARNIVASKKEFRSSAIGIILFPKNNRLYTLLIQRPTYEGSHSGQVSFPGGKMDRSDLNLEHTARRECFEEVNLTLNSGELIGELSDIYIPVSNFMVKPFIFYLHHEPDFKPDEREVEHLIYLNIDTLMNDDIQKNGRVQISKGVHQKNVPYFEIEQKIVWGATAMILSELKEILKTID